MVAAIPATTTTAPIPKTPRHTPRRAADLDRNPANPARPPLIPSSTANGNAAAVAPRRPAAKSIASRYLSSASPSPSPSPSSCTSTTSSSSSSSSTTKQRFPSPSPKQRPATPSSAKRSHSADRIRNAPPAGSPSADSRAICATTRSLSVSFQEESFFFRASKTKTASPSPARKPTPDRRRPSAAATPARTGVRSDGSTPFDHHRRWPAVSSRQSNSLTRSLDFSPETKEHGLTAIQLLRQSMLLASSNELSISSSSDVESSSSGSVLTSVGAAPRGVIVPARFLQETKNRLRRLPEPDALISTPRSRTAPPPKPVTTRKLLVDGQLSSPRSMSSPPRGPIRPSSPAKVSAPPSRGMSSPSRGRSGVSASSTPIFQMGNAPSIPSFMAEVRRAKRGENLIEEAHLLRLFYNKYLQWRFVNARASSVLTVQRLTAEKELFSAWINTSELYDSVTSKRINLQLLTQNLKLTSILRGQMTYLEEWSLIDRDHFSSLSGAIEALQASTLRLPVVGWAKADVQEVKNAVGSAVDVMQAMGTFICYSLAKVQGVSFVASELAKVAAQERALLEQSRDLLSMVAEMHVKHCSLQAQVLQVKHKPSGSQL